MTTTDPKTTATTDSKAAAPKAAPEAKATAKPRTRTTATGTTAKAPAKPRATATTPKAKAPAKPRTATGTKAANTTAKAATAPKTAPKAAPKAAPKVTPKPKDDTSVPKATAGKMEQIRNLLAKGEGEGVTDEERETYLAKAADLMAKYGVDRAMLAKAKPGSDKISAMIIKILRPFPNDKAQLLYAIAEAMRCEHAKLGGYGENVGVEVTGFGSDLERVEMMFTSLLLQMMLGLEKQEVPGKGNIARNFRRNWMSGFTTMVTIRIYEAEQAAAEAAASTAGGEGVALVLADRVALVKKAFEEAHPNIKTRTYTSPTGAGFGEGVKAGAQADVGGPRVNSPAPKALTAAK